VLASEIIDKLFTDLNKITTAIPLSTFLSRFGCCHESLDYWFYVKFHAFKHIAVAKLSGMYK